MNTWFDPGKEAEAAKALLAQGADILTQHTDSAAPLQEAEKAGKLAFDERLAAWAKDAKVILGRELRHSIEKVSPETAKPAA